MLTVTVRKQWVTGLVIHLIDEVFVLSVFSTYPVSASVADGDTRVLWFSCLFLFGRTA